MSPTHEPEVCTRLWRNHEEDSSLTELLMLSTSRRKPFMQKRRQTRLRLEELESRNLLSILGLHGAVVLNISFEPSAHADASLIAASSTISLREAHGHAITDLDVSAGRDLTSHLQVVAQAPQTV